MKKIYLYYVLLIIIFHIAISKCGGFPYDIILQNDTLNVKLIDELVWELRKSYPDRDLIVTEDIYEFTKTQSISFKYEETTEQFLEETIKIQQQDYQKIKELLLESFSVKNNDDNLLEIARANYNLAVFFSKFNFNKKALNYAHKSYQLYKKLDLENSVSRSANILGITYSRLNQYDNAIKYHSEALKIKEAYGVKMAMIHSLNNLGMINMQIKNLDSALFYFQRSQDICHEINTGYNLINIYINIGEIYRINDKHDIALKYYQKSIAIKRNFEVNLQSDLDNLWIGNYYYRLGKYEEALSNFKMCLSDEDSYSLKMVMTIIQKIAITYEKLHNYKSANIYYQQYQKLESILNDNMQEVFEIESILLERAEYEKKLSVQKNILQTRGILLIGTVIFLILTIIISVLVLRFEKEKIQKLKEKVDKLLEEQASNTMSAIIKGKDEERDRIARDLHDRLGGILSMVKNNFKAIDKSLYNLKFDNYDLYIKANELLDEACSEVRKISHNLSSGVLNKFGLTHALQELKSTIEEAGGIVFEIHIYGFSDRRLVSKIETEIYKIIQELSSNVLKHASATKIDLQLILDDKNLNILFEDDGQGFDYSEIIKKSGMGLKNIQLRVEQINGFINFDAKVGRGTIADINIPIRNNDLRNVYI